MDSTEYDKLLDLIEIAQSALHDGRQKLGLGQKDHAEWMKLIGATHALAWVTERLYDARRRSVETEVNVKNVIEYVILMEEPAVSADMGGI